MRCTAESVSARVAPGGNCTVTVEREMSSTGMNSPGSLVAMKIDRKKNRIPIPSTHSR